MADKIEYEKIEYEGEYADISEGMYGENADSYYERIESDDEVNKLVNKDNVYTDAYGNVYTEEKYSQINADPFVNYTLGGKKANILGLPPYYCKTADPNGRVFRNTIMAYLPYVFILPGKTVSNGRLIDASGDKVKKTSFLKLLDEAEDKVNLFVKGPRDSSDFRFLGFKPNYAEYYKYVETLCNSLYARLGFEGHFQFKDEFETKANKAGICFYCSNDTSISESNSNDYSQSSLLQKVNDMSAQTREFKTLMAAMDSGNGVSKFITKGLDFIKKLGETVEDGLDSISGLLGRTGKIFGRVVNGSQLLYPEIWSDSSYTKSYTLQFRFYSPYGDKGSIFKYVYVPFLALMSFSFPVQDKTLGYGQPFIIRMCSPGWFESSMGVVTDISWTKAPDNLWTLDNLPTEMTVSLTIKDMYSQMPISKNASKLIYNVGLSSYLDSLAGIRTDTLGYIEKISRKTQEKFGVSLKYWGHHPWKGSVKFAKYETEKIKVGAENYMGDLAYSFRNSFIGDIFF